MVVLDNFYQIVERDVHKVSPLWKGAHVFTCIISATCGLLTAFTFGRILNDFDYNCLIDAEIIFDNNTFLNTSLDYKPVRAIDLIMTNWGTSSACDFVQFTPLVIMISSVVWGMYFGMMSKGGAGHSTDSLSRPWSILYPCIFFTAFFFIVYVISTQRLKHGLNKFCLQFSPELNNTRCVPQIDMYTAQFREIDDNTLYAVYPNMVVSIISSEIGIWSWVFQLILCILRLCCVADFDLQLITIVKKEEEEVENVVEFSDDLEQISDI